MAGEFYERRPNGDIITHTIDLGGPAPADLLTKCLRMLAESHGTDVLVGDIAPDGWTSEEWAAFCGARDAAVAAVERGWEQTAAHRDATPPNSCNRHTDCAAAEARVIAGGGTINPTFHCHDDLCEDCFGS